MEVNYQSDQKNPETIINLKGLSLTINSPQLPKPINILQEDSVNDLVIQKGKKYGLIGRNGQGKTTLLKAILEGKIPSTQNAFGLEQRLLEGPQTIFEEIISANTDYLEWLSQKGVLKQKQEEMLANKGLDEEEEELRLAEEEDRLREVALANGYYTFEKQAKQILLGMGFPEASCVSNCPQSSLRASHQRSVDSFSGGWRMRLNLAKLLLNPTGAKGKLNDERFLILDEPTNHLDLHAISWLSRYLQGLSKVTLILVTHNMDFLNNIVDYLLEIDSGQLTLYRGNYEKYWQQKDRELQIKLKQFQKDRKKMKKTEARRLKPRETRVRVEIATEESTGRYEIKLDQVIFLYDQAKSSESTTEVFSYPEFTCKTGERAVIIGDNGSGKSTFLKLIMGKLEPISGQINCDPRIKFGYLSQRYAEILDYSLDPVSFLKREFPGHSEQDYRKHLSLVSLSPDRHLNSIETLSGGEQTRVIFAYLAFLQPNFIIFDEPTNNLDLYTIKTLSELINSLECGVILVTHDTYLVRELDDYRLYVCETEVFEDDHTKHLLSEYDGNIDDYLDDYFEESLI